MEFTTIGTDFRGGFGRGKVEVSVVGGRRSTRLILGVLTGTEERKIVWGVSQVVVWHERGETCL